MKWSSEALVAAVGFVVATGGGLLTTSSHWGAEEEKLKQIQSTVSAHDKRLTDQEQALNDQKAHDAAVEQKLDDVKDQLNRIEKKL
jgi:septal ring factor EnvC (AmiA/AmiB activator)